MSDNTKGIEKGLTALKDAIGGSEIKVVFPMVIAPEVLKFYLRLKFAGSGYELAELKLSSKLEGVARLKFNEKKALGGKETMCGMCMTPTKVHFLVNDVCVNCLRDSREVLSVGADFETDLDSEEEESKEEVPFVHPHKDEVPSYIMPVEVKSEKEELTQEHKDQLSSYSSLIEHFRKCLQKQGGYTACIIEGGCLPGKEFEEDVFVGAFPAAYAARLVQGVSKELNMPEGEAVTQLGFGKDLPKIKLAKVVGVEDAKKVSSGMLLKSLAFTAKELDKDTQKPPTDKKDTKLSMEEMRKKLEEDRGGDPTKSDLKGHIPPAQGRDPNSFLNPSEDEGLEGDDT